MSVKVATIARERVVQGSSLGSRVETWLYTVVVPGEQWAFKGRGLDWARMIAKKKGATKIVENF